MTIWSVSIKSSDVMMCAKAHEALAAEDRSIRFTSVSQKPERCIPEISNLRSDLESFCIRESAIRSASP